MYRLFLLIFILLSVSGLSAQDQTTAPVHRHFEVEIATFIAGPEGSSALGVGYATERQEVYFGLIPPHNSNPDYHSWGLMSGYKYYFIPRVKRVSVYLSYNLLYHKAFRRDLDIKYSAVINAVGPGFELRTFGEFYLFGEVGIGLYNRWNTKYPDLKWDSVVLLKFGVKKRFKKK